MALKVWARAIKRVKPYLQHGSFNSFSQHEPMGPGEFCNMAHQAQQHIVGFRHGGGKRGWLSNR